MCKCLLLLLCFFTKKDSFCIYSHTINPHAEEARISSPLSYLAIDFCFLWQIISMLNKGPEGPHIVHTSTMCNLYWQIRQDGNLVFPIDSEKNLVEDVRILFHINFRWIHFSCFRGEVKNVSAIRGQGGHLGFFFDQALKHKHWRRRWDFASCQVSLDSVQRCQRRSRKCLSQSEARAAILFFR